MYSMNSCSATAELVRAERFKLPQDTRTKFQNLVWERMKKGFKEVAFA